EKAREVENVDAIGQVGGLYLKIQSSAFLAVQLGARRHSQHKIGPHAAAVAIDAGENFLAVLSQQKVQIDPAGVDFRGQTAAVIRAERRPDALCGLHADAGADGVSLVLRDREAVSARKLAAGFAAEEKAAGNRSLRAGGLV